MNETTIILNLPTEVTFNMYDILNEIVEEAKKYGYNSELGILDFIDSKKFSEGCFKNNIQGYDTKYCNFVDQYDTLLWDLELSPISKENLKILRNILHNN